LQDFSPSLGTNEEAKWYVLVTINFHFATSQIFEEVIDSSCSIIFGTFFSITTSLDNTKEFLELNHFRTIIINHLNNFLNLLSVVN